MKKYAGYLIASDLDGTLINSKQCISKQNIDAISSFVKEGGLFAIATGRTELTAMPFIKSVKVNCPCILYNGAVIYDIASNSYIKSIFLNKIPILEPLKEILENYKSLCMQIFTQGKMFIVSGTENIDPNVISEEQPYEIVGIDDIINEDWVKVLMFDSTHTLQKIQQFLVNRLPAGIIHSVFSDSTYLELFASGVSKGSILEDLMKITGIKRERVIAIGDYCNDIEMIKIAGLGVATAMAHPLLKEVANITTVSNDEHAIHNLINKILPIYANTLDKNGALHYRAEQNDYIKISV